MNNKRDHSTDIPPLDIMKYCQLYLIFTIVFYFVGPVQWQTQNVLLLLFFVALYQVAFGIGYRRQMTRPIRSANNLVCNKDYIVRHFMVISLFALGLNLLLLIRTTSLYGISSIIQTMILSITDPTQLYHANATTQSSSEMFGGSIMAIIYALASPITVAVVPAFH